MRITKRQLRKIIREAINDGRDTVLPQPAGEKTTPCERWQAQIATHKISQKFSPNLSDYSPEAIEAAEAAVSAIGDEWTELSRTWGCGGRRIEREIRNYLEDQGLDLDNIMTVSTAPKDQLSLVIDDAMSVAGIILGVGPNTL